jgi:protein involved in polysaccharide export with SLBB domain
MMWFKPRFPGKLGALICTVLLLTVATASAQSNLLGGGATSGPLTSDFPSSAMGTGTGPVTTPQSVLPVGQAQSAYTGAAAPSAIGSGLGASTVPGSTLNLGGTSSPGLPSSPSLTSSPSVGSSPGTTGSPSTTASQSNGLSGGPAVGPGAAALPGGTSTGVSSAQQATSQLAPFGASLFYTMTPPSSLAPNPNYIIQPGDTVSIEIYGGVTATSTAVVDTQGNVFLPNFGPVHVAGTSAANLQTAVKQQLANAFTGNVSVYAVLMSESSISVYVTGFVKFPGQYLGSASDSVLDFISRAGGVDPSRGSYRDIELERGNNIIDHIDLYNFLLTGTPFPTVLQNGDTIIVGRQEAMVAVGGSVRNNYLFEVPDPETAGQEILNLAQPLPSATNVLITGTRGGTPFSTYVSLGALPNTPIFDQDQLTFVADIPAPLITVQVEGSRIGPSVIVADRDATLKTVLNYIAVDPTDADTKAVYIVRPGLQQQQSVSIQAALDRLQKALFYATSVTTGEAQIRASEAQQIQAYINQAHTIQPTGILVVADGSGTINDARLEDGDTIVIPESSDTVMVDGEVEVPQAVNFVPGQSRAAYIAAAGGLTQRGQVAQTIIRRLSGQMVLDPNAPVMAGDELIVMPHVETENFVIAQDMLTVFTEIAASAYFIGKL